jgi:hypothetical protein
LPISATCFSTPTSSFTSNSQAMLPNPRCHHHESPLSRRDFLSRAGGGFGALALSGLLGTENAPASPSAPHHVPGAKNVIFLFMEGGPSHIDLFDPKPEVNRFAGKQIPASIKPVITAMGEFHSPILECKRTWKQHGDSGTWISDWLPHTARIADDISVIRSCWCDGLNHVGSVCQMNTGSVLAGRPSLGAWATYGLGSDNSSLPSFVVLKDTEKKPHGGNRNWGAGFMPNTYQGTLFQNGEEPISNLANPPGISTNRQRAKLDFLHDINSRHARDNPARTDLESRIKTYELAFRMQSEAPLAINIDAEPEHIHKLYGTDQPQTKDVARNCILARRLVERGVRFVQVYCGSGSAWDAHAKIEENHTKWCRATDQPAAALIHDLKQRGMLDDTLVIWGGEFGRTPMSEKGDGRDHNPYGFTMWMAGGGVKPGQTIGRTDDFGLHAIEDRAHIHDLHATILHALGLHHLKLNYVHNGRRESPTINEGKVIRKLFV